MAGAVQSMHSWAEEAVARKCSGRECHIGTSVSDRCFIVVGLKGMNKGISKLPMLLLARNGVKVGGPDRRIKSTVNVEPTILFSPSGTKIDRALSNSVTMPRMFSFGFDACAKEAGEAIREMLESRASWSCSCLA